MSSSVAFVLLAFFCSMLSAEEFVDIDVNDEGVVEASKSAAKKIQVWFKTEYLMKAERVVNATVRRNSLGGNLYIFTLGMRRTKCKKTDVVYEDVECCGVVKTAEAYKDCSLKFLHKSTCLKGDFIVHTIRCPK